MSEKYENKANELYKQGNWNRALNSYHKALDLAVTEYGEDSQNVARLHNEIAMVYHKQESFTEALKHYSTSLCLTIWALGETHPNVANAYNNIAVIYRRQKKYDKALEYNNKALDIKIATLGDDHPQVANTYNNIAVLYEKQNEFDKALILHQKSLAITLHTLGTAHPHIANSYTNIGIIFDNQKNYNMALQYYNKALEVKKILILKQHEKNQTNAGNKNNHPMVDDIDNVIYNHPNIATTYHKMAHVYSKKSDRYSFHQAVLYYKKAMEIYEQRTNHDDNNNNSDDDSCYKFQQIQRQDSFDSTVLQICNDIALLYKNSKQQQYDQAIFYYDKALQLQLNKLTVIEKQEEQVSTTSALQCNEHPRNKEFNPSGNKNSNTNTVMISALLCDITQTYINLANSYQKQNLLDKAIDNYLKAKQTMVRFMMKRREQEEEESSNIVPNSTAADVYASYFNNNDDDNFRHDKIGCRGESFTSGDENIVNSTKTDDIPYPEIITNIYNSLATAYYRKGEYKIALECHHKAIKVKKKCKRRKRQERKKRLLQERLNNSYNQIHDDSFCWHNSFSSTTTITTTTTTTSNSDSFTFMDGSSSDLSQHDYDFYDDDDNNSDADDDGLQSRENLFWSHLEAELNYGKEKGKNQNNKTKRRKRKKPTIKQQLLIPSLGARAA